MKKLSSYHPPVFLAILLGISACNYFPDNETGGLTSITIYDTAVDFSKYTRFAISDSIGYLQLKLNEISGKVTPAITYKKDPKTEIIRASVLDKLMQYCNYTDQVKDKSQRLPPDLIIDLLYMDVPGNNSFYSDWWSVHHYWYTYEWFRNYPYFPYYPVSMMIPAQGTLIMDMKDLTGITMIINLDKNERIPVPSVWVGMVGGLNNAYNETTLNDAIGNCFTQTEAFKKNKKTSL
ncbi:MAG: hypothetical protein LBD87_07300 [Prevotellaceae bacterium]|jgi:hypothetical protein|nr:hypothetical protein [Prevotellaceae bacterium]